MLAAADGDALGVEILEERDGVLARHAEQLLEVAGRDLLLLREETMRLTTADTAYSIGSNTCLSTAASTFLNGRLRVTLRFSPEICADPGGSQGHNPKS